MHFNCWQLPLASCGIYSSKQCYQWALMLPLQQPEPWKSAEVPAVVFRAQCNPPEHLHNRSITLHLTVLCS